MPAKQTPIQKTSILFKGVPLHLKNIWQSVCIKRGKKMKQRLIELMRQDIQADAVQKFKGEIT